MSRAAARLLLLAAAALALSPGARAAAAPRLGINLEPAHSDTPLHFFADAIRQSRGFYDAAAKWGTAAPLDAAGWPTVDTIVVLGSEAARLDGPDPYRLTFRGTADVSVTGGTVRKLQYDRATNTTSAEVVIAQAGNNFLRFERSWRRGDHRPDETGNVRGIRDVRLIRPGNGPGDVFDRRLLARLAHFGTVRPAIGINGVNDNPMRTWAERTLPGAPVQSSYETAAARSGIAWEYDVLLANAARADLWLTLPLRLDDDHVRRLALLLRYGSDGVNPYTSPQANPVYPPLAPGLHVYVEYANELWNALFWTTRENVELAQREAAAGDPYHYGRGTPWDLAQRRMARRLVEISDVFREVFGDEAMMTRVRPVLAAQIVNPATFEIPLEYLGATYGPGNRLGKPGRTPGQLVYAVAGAPYLPDVEHPESVDAVFRGWEARGAGEIEGAIDRLAKVSAAYGVRMIAYEAGQHLLPGSGGGPAKEAAQRDPRMKAALVRLLDHWFRSGGDLANYYSLCGAWGSWGFWGLSTDLASEDGPKWAAVKAFTDSPR